MDDALRTQRKIIFLENLERDTEIDIKNKIDYHTASNYRKARLKECESNPVPKRENAFLGSLGLASERLAMEQYHTKGTTQSSGLKPLKGRFA